MRTLAMFPLGSVLFPAMPLRLRVFEQRYLIMLDRMLKSGSAEFGVVLIERGQEVGGGEQRFGIGTVAEIVQLNAEDGFVGLVAEGRERFEVTEWLTDDPYPRAIVSDLPPLDWPPELAASVGETEQIVRRTLAMASEFAELVWPSDVELSDEQLKRVWQLAAIAPVGPLDHQGLLGAASLEELLAGTVKACGQAVESFQAPWPEQDDPEPV